MPELPGAWSNDTPKDDPVPRPERPRPKSRAIALFQQNHLAEAATLLANAPLQGESADLGSDWAVVNLPVAARAFRRALPYESTHHCAANLGVQLSRIGDPADAAVFLRQALARTVNCLRRVRRERKKGVCAGSRDASLIVPQIEVVECND